ncbi:hypothetical protein T484DRAFT_2027956, partial [Baffinella frigidus]
MAVRDRAGRQRRAPLEPPRPPRLSPRQLRGRQTPLLLQRRALPALRHSLRRSHRTRWPPSSSAPPRALVPLATSTTPRRLDRKNRLLHPAGHTGVTAVDFSKLAEEALKRALAGLKEADKLAQTSDWDGACKQMLYAHAALRFCEGGKAEMDGVETLRSELKALQAKLPEPERSKLAALVKDGSASQPIWTTVGHTAPRADREDWKKFLAALPSVEERERDAELDGRILRGHEIVVANLEQLKRV